MSKRPNIAASSTASIPSATAQSDDDATSNESEDSNASTTVTGSQQSLAQVQQQQDSLEKLDERSDLEKELFDLIEDGDDHEVENILRRIKDENLDIDYSHKDLKGHDLLTHAVEHGRKRMVQKILLTVNCDLDTKEALLHAIKENRMGIFLVILEHEELHGCGGPTTGSPMPASTKPRWKKKSPKKKTKKSNAQHQVIQSFDMSEYGNDVTPMMMAAKHGRYEMMVKLYARGDRLPTLHMPSCSCSQCKWKTRDMERSLKRIHLLEAMANPTYLMFMANQDGDIDPVFQTLELSTLIQECIDEEPEYKKEYEEILEVTKKLPRKLLNLCRNTEETKTFLCPKEGYIGPSSMPFPRLAVAIERHDKDFVAHPNVQFLLQNEFNGPIWATSKTDWERIWKFLIIAVITTCYPIVQLLLAFGSCFCGGLPVVKYLLSPRNRCWSKLAAHVYFCLLLFIMNTQDRPPADNEPPTERVRWFVLAYVASHLLVLFRRFMLHPGIFYKSGWNIFDLVTLILFGVTFGLWGLVWLNNSALKPGEIIHRKMRHSEDPLLLCECTFALASLFATLRLLKWFIFWPTLGPFQSGLYRMATKVAVILVFVFWTIITFAASSNIIFRPYKNLTKWDEQKLKTKDQPTDMMELDILTMQYFVGELGPDETEIFPVKAEHPSAGPMPPDGYEHETTQMFATILCILWNVVAVAFLKEMVVGLFASTGEEMFEAKDTEWKYDRAKEMIYFIQDGHLAPPLNMLPNGPCCSSWCTWMSAMTCRKNGKVQAGCSCAECCYVIDAEDPNMGDQRRRQYPFLMRSLFQRFLKEEADDDDDNAQKEDVELVQEEVKEVRQLCEKVLGIKKKPKVKVAQLLPPQNP